MLSRSSKSKNWRLSLHEISGRPARDTCISDSPSQTQETQLDFETWANFGNEKFDLRLQLMLLPQR